VLPFGLAHAPWLFSKIMGHCARFLRSPGIGYAFRPGLSSLSLRFR
jgi:hypothetical protein